MPKEKDGPPGLSQEEVFENSTDIDIEDPQAAAIATLTAIKAVLQDQRQTHRPLMAMAGNPPRHIRALMEQIQRDEWLKTNAVIVCFDNTSGNRHVALARAKDATWWRSSAEAKRGLKTENITTYEPGNYATEFLETLHVSIN